MLKLIFLSHLMAFFLWSGAVSAGEYLKPDCYTSNPTTCSFDEMTLAMCNAEGRSRNIVFLLNHRLWVPGGNSFGSADLQHVCTVKGVAGSDPKRYKVQVD